jgi:hypothetical protein
MTFQPDIVAANAPAAEPSLGARSELNASATRGAQPNADQNVDVGAGNPAAFPQPRLNVFPTPRPGPNVDDHDKTRTAAVRDQAPGRDGVIACQTAAGRGGYWAWRLIDGRKCWYEGKVGMSKDNLRWVRSD